MNLPVGTVLKSWIVDKRLGEGAFSEVYEVHSATDPSKHYAMKVAALVNKSKKQTKKNVITLSTEAIRLHWEYTVRTSI